MEMREQTYGHSREGEAGTIKDSSTDIYTQSEVAQSCPTVTPWTVAHQASPTVGFSSQEYWSGLPFPSPGDLLDPAIESTSLALPG